MTCDNNRQMICNASHGTLRILSARIDIAAVGFALSDAIQVYDTVPDWPITQVCRRVQ
jgi:hypothetical protein